MHFDLIRVVDILTIWVTRCWPDFYRNPAVVCPVCAVGRLTIYLSPSLCGIIGFCLIWVDTAGSHEQAVDCS